MQTNFVVVSGGLTRKLVQMKLTQLVADERSTLIQGTISGGPEEEIGDAWVSFRSMEWITED